MSDEDTQELQHMLAYLPSDIPQLDIDTKDIDQWMYIIKTTKSNSAPGADGIHACELQMLPKAAIQNLVKIIHESPSVIPNNLMCGRTIPLAKKWGLCRASESRPITILPQIYRIWARLVAHQVITQISQWVPPQVTGFLKGRGAFEAAYDTQQWLEQKAKDHSSRAGATLDLIKCFNLIRRSFASRALQAIGCPLPIIRKWEESTMNLRRYWEIQGQISELVHSTTGCAEGDPVSVLVMIAIATMWVYRAPYTAPGVRLSAFADNWSWASTDHTKHAQIAEATKAICNLAKLQVDPTKTWVWASDPTAETAIKTAAATLSPSGEAPKKVQAAKDLGFFLQYTGAGKLGSLLTRMEEGKQRLHRIMHQQWPLEVKVHIIKSSVYPAMFHGSEITPIGQEHLSKIRHLVAQAVLNKSSRCLSSALLLMFTQHILPDPGMHVILQSIKKERQWLIKAPEQERQAFLTTASKHRGLPGTAKGPASTLKSNIMQLGWSITRKGDIQVSTHRFLNMMYAPMQEIQYWAYQAWNATAVKLLTQRFSLYSYPEPDVPATIQVLKKFPSHEQRKLLHELGNAFQTEAQKAKYDKTCEGTCQFCQEPDSKEHRYLRCPVTREVREEHAAAVTILQDECPGWIDWPVMYKHPMFDFIHAVRHGLPEATIPADTCRQLLHLNPDTGPNLFSDGSCLYPSAVETRYAAYALIADLAPDDQCRQHQAMRFLATNQMPDTLATITYGRLPDMQTIHRAELLVIVLATEALPAFNLYTDSSAAKSAFDTATQAASCQSFINNPHFDLMCRIFAAKKPGQFVHKIKAHRDLHTIPNLLEVYKGLGNHKADQQASMTLQQHMPEVGEELATYHKDVTKDQQCLHQVFTYIIALQNARAQAQPATRMYTMPDTEAGDPVTFLATWSADEYWTPPRRLQNQGLRDCAFGLQAAWACQQWLLSCKWPTRYIGPDNKVVGITWIEVALAIARQMRTFLPVRRQNSEGETILLYISNYAEARKHHVTLVEQSETAYTLVRQVLDIIPERLMPDSPFGQVRSMYILGDAGFRGGIQLRPYFEGQAEVTQQTACYLQNNKALPHLYLRGTTQWQSDQPFAAKSWKVRMEQAKARMRIISDVRRGVSRS